MCLWLLLECIAGSEVNDYQRKGIALEKCAVDTIILGSSHAFYGILANQQENSSSYNLSWSSQTLDETFWLSAQVPDSVHLMICVSPFTLSSTMNDRIERWRNVLFNRYFQWLSSDWREMSFLFSLGGRRTTRMALNGLFETGPTHIDEHGNGSRGWRKPDFQQSAQEAFDRHFVRPNNPELKNLLVQLSKRPNTSFFTVPFHSTYQERIKTAGNWVETTAILDSLSSYHGVAYYNHSELNLPDSCFWDADHLNTSGRAQFTTALTNSLRQNNLNKRDSGKRKSD